MGKMDMDLDEGSFDMKYERYKQMIRPTMTFNNVKIKSAFVLHFHSKSMSFFPFLFKDTSCMFLLHRRLGGVDGLADAAQL